VIVNGKKITGKESIKLSNPSLVTISDSIDESHRAYVNFVSSIKSPITKKAYLIRLKYYLRSSSISFLTFDELLSRSPRLIEQGIIELLIEMRHNTELSYSAQNVFLSALTHFFSINDVVINRKKIKKFMSESENKYEYRSYTSEEIARLLEISDEREKVIILLLASTGMRVGAVHPLLLKDLKKWVIDESGNYIYQLQVYSSSSKYRYYTILTHPTEEGILFVYKSIIKGGKGRERNGKIFAFIINSDSNSIKEIAAKDIWDYRSSTSSAQPYNELDVIKGKDLADAYVDKYTHEILKETTSHLAEIEFKTEESIIRYYSKQIEESNSKILEYGERISESPTYARHIKKEKDKIISLQKELKFKLDETKRDFRVIPFIELIGLAIIERQVLVNESKQYSVRPNMIPRLNDFSKQNQQINSENSETTHNRLQKNPTEWYEYHKRFEEIRKSWIIDPQERIIQRL
jgi:hypothetical protein